MKKLYNKYRQYFCVPAEGEVNEKTLMHRIALSIAVVVICMGAMSISAYAFVTWNVTSGVNVIKSAHFGEAVAALSEVTADEKGVYQLTEGEHSFTLGHAGDATTGYYKILIDEDRDALLEYDPINGSDVKWTYFSRQVMQDTKEQQTVTIIVPEGATVYVDFISEWGTYSGDDATIKIDLTGEEFESVMQELQEEPNSEEQLSEQNVDSEEDAITGGDSEEAAEQSQIDESSITEPAVEQEQPVTESTEATEPTQPAETQPTEPVENTEILDQGETVTDPTDVKEPVEPTGTELHEEEQADDEIAAYSNDTAEPTEMIESIEPVMGTE